MIGYIYKITNRINGKTYIGKTAISLEHRWQSHCTDAIKDNYSNRPLYSAINKYGKDNFSIELVEENEEDILSEREIYWINYYNSFKEGYNATLGGEGKCLYDYEQILSLLNEGKSTNDIVNIVHCCVDIVYMIAQKYNINLTERANQALEKKIGQYSRNGEFIQSFKSRTEATQYLINENITKGIAKGIGSHITHVALGKRKTAYGFIWKYI